MINSISEKSFFLVCSSVHATKNSRLRKSSSTSESLEFCNKLQLKFLQLVKSDARMKFIEYLEEYM